MRFARTLITLGLLAALAGCHTCWIDRDDDRPMKHGSLRDCLDYGWWGECYHPKYHGGPPDGVRDHHSVKRAAIKAANRALAEQNCGQTSRDFEFGFQQAYIDVANGGSGALPAVPPPRYWTAPYRTLWGHNKARDWFAGYQAGVSSAQSCITPGSLTVPTSVCRESDHGLGVVSASGSLAVAPFVDASHGWNPNGGMMSPSPLVGAPAPPIGLPATMSPAAANSCPLHPYSGPMTASPNTWTTPPTEGTCPSGVTSSFPTASPGAWPSGSPPTPPPYSTPAVPPSNGPAIQGTTPAVPGGGYSIPTPGTELITPPAHLPGSNGSVPNPPPQGNSVNNPWGPFRGLNGFGFKPEGVLR